MKMISTEERLPEDGQMVLIFAGNYHQGTQWDVVKFKKGISIKEREAMENGTMPFEMVRFDNWETSERWKVYTGADEHGNNKRPYNWIAPPMQYFGQYVTFWAELPVIE